MPAGANRKRRVTMADVARSAGVSVMTVSYTFNQPERVSEAARERVYRSAERLKYAGPDPAARSLRRGRCGSLGVVLGENLTYAFDDPQASRFLAGVAAVCVEHQMGMTLIPVSGADTDADRVREAAVDGFVLWAVGDNDKVLDAAIATGRPVAAQGGPAKEQVNAVAIDNRTAARAIAEVVFAGAQRPAIVAFHLDHRRQAGVLHGPDPQAWLFAVTRSRLSGMREYLTGAGYRWESIPVAVVAHNHREGSHRLLAQLVSEESPDAVAAMSDELALSLLDVLADAPLAVPDDVAVSGWDDEPMAEAAGLTTVRHSLFEQGTRCARIVLGDDVDLSEPPSWSVVRRKTTR